MFHHSKRISTSPSFSLSSLLRVIRYGAQAMALVWQTSRKLTLFLACLTLVAGLLPALTAYVGKLIVDAVVLASQSGAPAHIQQALWYVALEAGIIAVQAGAQRGLGVCQTLLRALLSQQVNVMILEKTIHLELRHFEDAEFYDRLTQARREASVRPLSLVNRSFALLQNSLSLLSYGGLLLAFSPWAVLVLAIAGLPAFVVETRFSSEAFRLFKWRSPETRKRAYLEMVLAREDFAKEVQLFELGPTFLQRYRTIFDELYREDRNLTLRRGLWGYLLGLLSSAAFYGAYGWIVWETVHGAISLGDMTMYLLLFRQGQAAFSASLTAIGGMHEDNLYLANLYSFLEERAAIASGGVSQGANPGDGLRFEQVSFRYPEADDEALKEVSFHLQPGQKLALVGENGSGKTTLIKLLTRLYLPTSGRIVLDGTDLNDWSVRALRKRIGVIFQDFVRYQFSVGQNIGAGDVTAFEDADRWQEAARKGLALPFIDRLPTGFTTQLGKWFHQGQELSGGQWQKIALSRAFMRRDADLLVLDEPTAAIDAEAEMRIFEQFRQEARHQMAILISHRFSTVRMADHIIVLQQGAILEQGSHESLLESAGRYAQLFHMQAAGYR